MDEQLNCSINVNYFKENILKEDLASYIYHTDKVER